jgi:DNA-binding Lrp family transcriptional regulator
MSLGQILDDSLNVELLRLICSGTGVEINISELSDRLKKHRNTIASRVENLFTNGIIDRPFQPFPKILAEYPLLVLEKANLPRNRKTNIWIEKNPHIWAAFFVKDEEYNTLLIELHEDLHAYLVWRENIIDGEYISSEAIYLSTKAIIKNDPAASIELLKANFQNSPQMEMNGLTIDQTYLDLMEALLLGKSVWTNPNSLARKLNVHRMTVQRRLDLLLQEKIISNPVSRFPRMWAPPEHFIVLSLIELKRQKDHISKALIEDPHTSLIVRAGAGKYNLLAISSFSRLRDHLTWEEKYDQRFSGSIGAVKNLYLSPSMTFSIHQQYVPLAYLERRLEKLRGQKLD